MLLVLFKVDDEQYALETTHIEEIVPELDIRKIPGTELSNPGVIDYHGKVVPIIDLTALTAGRSSEKLLSTRIILVKLGGGIITA